MVRFVPPLLALLGALGCGGPSGPVASPPPIEVARAGLLSPPTAEAALPPTWPDAPIEEEPEVFDPTPLASPLLALAPPASLVPPAPELCQAWVGRKPEPPPPCTTPAEGLAALDWALEKGPGNEQDARLVAIEGCAFLDVGLVRSVRVERAPTECGDALSLPLLHAPSAGLRGPFGHVLLGAAGAARAFRLAGSSAPPDRGALLELAQLLRSMPRSYGRALALAGVAEAWDRARPRREDEAMAANLLAVQALGAEGVGDSPRVERALAALARRYGWLAEVDALRWPVPADVDRRPSPPRRRGAPTCSHCADSRRRAVSFAARLAEELPSFAASQVIGEADLASPDVLRVWARAGTLPLRARAALPARPSEEVAQLVAQARLTLGLRYMDRGDVDAAARLLAPHRATSGADGRYLHAVAVAFRRGPSDLAQWTASPPRGSDFDRTSLEAVARSAGREVADREASHRALFALDVLRTFEAGDRVGGREELARPLAELGAVLAGGRQPIFLWERWNSIRSLLEQIDAQPGYRAGGPVRLIGWPEVRPTGGTWREPTGTIHANVRAGHVHRTLRRLSHRFEPCFAAALTQPTPPSSVRVHFVIERQGLVPVAVVESDPPGAKDLEDCVKRATKRLEFPQPDMGLWDVEATFRVR